MPVPVLYLNENIEIEVGDLLKTRSFNAVHTIQVGNRGKSDEFQLEYAAKNKMIMLTHNRCDFRKLHGQWLSAGKTHSGVLLIGCVGPLEIVNRVDYFLQNRLPILRPPFCETLQPL